MPNKTRVLAALFVAAIFSTTNSAIAQTDGHSHPLTIEQLIDIKFPTNPVWSPDGKKVAFLWDRADIVNLYLANADGNGAPVALTSYPDGKVDDVFWSHDGTAIYYSHGGQLWKVASLGGTPQPASTAEQSGSITPSPDGQRIALVRPGKAGSELIVRSLADGTEIKLAESPAHISGISWSLDGSRIAYVGDLKIVHHDESPAYSGAKLVYRVTEQLPGQLYVVASTGGSPAAIGAPGHYGHVFWIGNTHLTFETESSDYRTRTINIADTQSGFLQAIHSDKEDKFWSIPGWGAKAQPQPSPDGKWVCFLSDVDGWDHLYVMPARGGNAVQITKGHFEAWRPSWSHDSKKIAFDANEPDHPGDRRLGIASIGSDASHATVSYITTGTGTNVEPQWSPDDKSLVYQHTDTKNPADLFVIAAAPGSQPVRLSDSLPAGVDRSEFVAPEFVHYPGPDGKPVPGWLFVPKNLDRTKKHPAIVWIHGDGINQNYDGWHIQRNYSVYYSFHQYLLQQGYVVFAPDYRGSIGYGREWRNGVYMDVGGNDAKDAWMAANYLKTLPYVDSDHMGVWGLSYGGFFTLIAVTDQPTLFRAAVDVAGVVDYAMYYSDPYHGDWTASRIGTPEQNPQVYAQASPISHIDRLARPLLVLHGTADVNVPYLESVWLIDEALKKGKGDLITFMMYPGEFHYFSREHVLDDAWHRVDNFFAHWLKEQ